MKPANWLEWSQQEKGLYVPSFDILPPWLRSLGRGARFSTYGLIMGVFFGDLMYTSNHLGWEGDLSDWGCLFAIGVSALALYASVTHRWRWEWTLSFWLAFLVCVRAGFVWLEPGPPPPITDGSLTAVVAIFLFLRGIDLSVFAIKSGTWKTRPRQA